MAPTNTTLLFPTRRRLMTLLGASAVLPSLVTTGTAAPATEATRRELMCRYAAWLHMEHRLLSVELWPEMGQDADRFIPADRHASMFFWSGGDQAPPPSTRAAAILTAAGVTIEHDPHGLWL